MLLETKEIVEEQNHHFKQNGSSAFDEHTVLHELKHFLPAQASLKDFIHHNTLHAFQEQPFFEGLRDASEKFGYKVLLTLDEYRSFYFTNRIKSDVLLRIIADKKGAENATIIKEKLLFGSFGDAPAPRIGNLRSKWKAHYHIDLDSIVHPTLFRILCSYLDQGIAAWKFPVWNKGFLASLKDLEKNSFTSFFRTKRVKEMLLNDRCNIESLLDILVGDKALNKQYLFDQQFAHQGWSGMVSVIEDQPETLLDRRKISLHDLIIFEMLLEIDALDFAFGEIWAPLSKRLEGKPTDLFEKSHKSELFEALVMWQEAFEWTYYDDVLAGLKIPRQKTESIKHKSFQAIFCIDDRECSLRRYLENNDKNCETFGTPGFFGVEFYFQPEHSKFYTKVCPAPVTPKYLIKESGTKGSRKKDHHFTPHSHSLLQGWLISQTLGFWSAFKLLLNIFKPSIGPASSSSFRHMDRYSKLTIENKKPEDKENGLQIGFTIEEMATRVEGLLRCIGLLKDFAPIIYVVGHGSSSVNNPHYSAYDCGACSGRPGSVNARVFSFMANHEGVRKILAGNGIHIPTETKFTGGLHDTATDDVEFYEIESLPEELIQAHQQNVGVFEQALDLNSKERSRRLDSVNTHAPAKKVHEDMRKRTVSLFEPRPELNHATNSLCIVGCRSLTKHLFLDRRAFMNSYDYNTDPDGKYLLNILRPAAPVCGGINLEYFFSRMDNQKLGAGTKLPHNVMGLFAVANGADGDLRPGLPVQMIEVHDPVRLLVIVEHFPEVIINTLSNSPETFEWFLKEWIHLVSVHPETGKLYIFKNKNFEEYTPLNENTEKVVDLMALFENNTENIPVHTL